MNRGRLFLLLTLFVVGCGGQGSGGGGTAFKFTGFKPANFVELQSLSEEEYNDLRRWSSTNTTHPLYDPELTVGMTFYHRSIGEDSFYGISGQSATRDIISALTATSATLTQYVDQDFITGAFNGHAYGSATYTKTCVEKKSGSFSWLECPFIFDISPELAQYMATLPQCAYTGGTNAGQNSGTVFIKGEYTMAGKKVAALLRKQGYSGSRKCAGMPDVTFTTDRVEIEAKNLVMMPGEIGGDWSTVYSYSTSQDQNGGSKSQYQYENDSPIRAAGSHW